MSKFSILLALVLGSLVVGCAQVNTAHPEAGQVDDAAVVNNRVSQQGGDAVYYLLAAELAGQRGQYEVALDNYLKAAALTQDVKVLQRATQIALFLKNNDKALDAATQWLAREPESTEARRLLALLCLKAGRDEEALVQMSALLEAHEADAENTVLDWVKIIGTDVAKDKGLGLMRRLAERFPKLAEVHFAYGLLASEKGEYPLALTETEKVLALRPDYNRARLLQAQVMSKTGEPEKAKKLIQQTLQKDPSNDRLRFLFAQYLAKSGDLRGAERELGKVLAKDPHNEDALLGMALAHLESGRESKARQLLLRLTASPNRKSQAYFYLGMIEARNNLWANAVEWFDKASEGPMALEAQMNAVSALVYQGQIPEARQRLDSLRKQNPQEASRLYLLEGDLLTKNKMYNEAFDLLGRAIVELPGQGELLYTHALVAEELGRMEVMEADLKAVLEKNPNDPNALNALGFSLADRSLRLDEAKAYIGKALELRPGEPAILDSYGWVHYRLGDLSTALEYLRQAYGLLKDPEIGAHYGEILWVSGRQADAKKIWLESMRKDPEHADIKNVMARFPEAFK